MPAKETDQLAIFYELSELLTGFDQTELLGAGVGPVYFDKLIEGVGKNNVCDLLKVVIKVRGSVAQFRREIWHDAEGRFGPIARNIILMWYLGSWFPLSQKWREEHGGEIPHGEEGVISSAAYRTGFVWRAIGAHAPGADPPGFGSWSTEPGRIGGTPPAKGKTSTGKK